MKIGIIICSNDAETVWNAFRFGVFAIEQGDTATAFLSGKGVEADSIGDEHFDVTEQMETFLAAGGEILACGTCLKVRQSKGSELCPMSSMKELYNMVKTSDKVVSF